MTFFKHALVSYSPADAADQVSVVSSAAAAVLDEEELAPTASVLEEEATEEEKVGYEFDEEFQTKIAAMQLRDTIFASRTDGLVLPAYFENDIDAAIVGIARDYYTTYKKAPEWGVLGTLLKDLIAKKRIRSDLLKGLVPRLNELKALDISDRDYVVDQVADFAKNKAIEAAMMASISALEKKDYATIQKRMAEAMIVGANDDLGEYDYWGEIESRTKERHATAAGTFKPDGITTGVPELDDVLYHKGWGRKELSALMGAAKAGKSMALADFGQAASLAGYNVLYCSCEVAAKIIAARTDANVSQVALKLVGAHPEKVKDLVDKAGGKAGAFQIREFATGSLSCAMLRRILERYRAKGIQFDLIITDYADIMAPDHRRDEERENSKQVWEGLRAIAFEENAAVLTATQSNREGAKSVTAKGLNVAEDYNKVRTADVFITINATDAERSTGEARLYMSEMRNSESGFTLRIRQQRDTMTFISRVLGRE